MSVLPPATKLSWVLYWAGQGETRNTGPLADAIIADPRAHIDALVEAGVLERAHARTSVNIYPFEDGRAYCGDVYVIALPHEHDPEVWLAAETGETVVGCKGCNAMVKVEWP